MLPSAVSRRNFQAHKHARVTFNARMLLLLLLLLSHKNSLAFLLYDLARFIRIFSHFTQTFT